MQGWRGLTSGLQGMGPKVSREPNQQPGSSLATVPVWRCRQNEIESGQLDRAQGTGQSKRVLDRLGVGLKKVPKQQEFSAWIGRKC